MIGNFFSYYDLPKFLKTILVFCLRVRAAGIDVECLDGEIIRKKQAAHPAVVHRNESYVKKNETDLMCSRLSQ